MELNAVLTSSVIAGIGAALLNGFWNRRAAKKIPKTEMRADAYRDFVVHLVSANPSDVAGAHLNNTNSLALAEIKARLLLFGESNVVSAVSAFLTSHTALNGESAVAAFVKVVCAMRKSLLTGHRGEVADSIRCLLLSESDKHTKPLNSDVRQASLPHAG